MNVIKEIKGLEIIKVIAGGGNGSIVVLDIESDNNKYTLFIYCCWRMTLNDKVIIGWNDDIISEDSSSLKILRSIKNSTIIDIEENDYGDFNLHLSNDKKLQIFCDITSNGNKDDINENWSLCDIKNNKCYNFNNRYDIVLGSYE